MEAGRDLTASALADLGTALPELVDKGVTVVRLEVGKVLEFDSAALEGLLEFDALARSRGLAMELTAPAGVLATVLGLTGLASRLSVQGPGSAAGGASGP